MFSKSSYTVPFTERIQNLKILVLTVNTKRKLLLKIKYNIPKRKSYTYFSMERSQKALPRCVVLQRTDKPFSLLRDQPSLWLYGYIFLLNKIILHFLLEYTFNKIILRWVCGEYQKTRLKRRTNNIVQ